MTAVWQGVLSSAVGIVFVIVARLIDRYLPDPTGKHPLPPGPPPR